MSNYFRITAYHPELDATMLADSNGKFQKLWQFSAALIEKGFKIIEVGNDEKFLEGNVDKVEYDANVFSLRNEIKGKPTYTNYEQDGIKYKAISIGDHIYIPDRNVLA